MASGAIPKVMPTEYTDSGTTSSNSIFSKNYTVNGNGYVIVSASIFTDTTSDIGFAYASIEKGSTVYARQQCSLDYARAYNVGASACAAIPVSNGNTITIALRGNKSGSKEYYRSVLAFGCTLTTS